MLLFIFVYFIFVIINNRVLNQKAQKQFKWEWCVHAQAILIKRNLPVPNYDIEKWIRAIFLNIQPEFKS